jgi:transposase
MPKVLQEQYIRPTSDPDARITKMKDGTAHLAHKAEHAVDLTSGALVAVTLQPADKGDTSSIHKTLEAAQEELQRVELAVEEVVADKGYHSGAVLTELHGQELRSYIPEP